MKKVYILTQSNLICGVYATKESAFKAIRADQITQTIRTSDGEEEIFPTSANFVLGVDIYMHIIMSR